MFARSSLARGLHQCCAKATPSARRGMAAAAINPFHYFVGDASGVKVASRDDNGPTTSLAVVVRGGSRYQPAPGVAQGLAGYAFKNTTKRSALRLQREAELLGGSLSSYLSRENIVLKAKFLRNDLPYFVEALGEVLSKTKFLPYEFNEEIAPALAEELAVYSRDPAAIAYEHAHNVAFHTGLGGHKLSMSPKFTRRVTLLLSPRVPPRPSWRKWTSQFFADVPQGNGISSPATKYFGGENRIYGARGDSLVIAFPGSQGGPSFKAEYIVLSYLLGGQSGTKWNAGTSILSQAVNQMTDVKAVAQHVAYSDAGLLSVTITGPHESLQKAGEEVVKGINSLTTVKAEDMRKAIAQAKFDVLSGAEDRSHGLELVGQSVIASGKAPQVVEVVKALEGVTVSAVQQAAKALLDSRATFTAVGDLHNLPFASDIGLKA
ncbi:Metalloenzyme, LuxS/M16 peptidase-like protein [Sphaerosporella brunnea]|uniref:Cytochrome b-c1 complex subunit 2, mitochondrial n=1 Tax=Sphaerosporella brunnea TaxID=1250544 RepID=A0A5J5F7Q0_9PEZI|nr:Metalloenzyme, LuxS/M16 peptidase-like protein [Sphaerosporella brunnea]